MSLSGELVEMMVGFEKDKGKALREKPLKDSCHAKIVAPQSKSLTSRIVCDLPLYSVQCSYPFECMTAVADL